MKSTPINPNNNNHTLHSRQARPLPPTRRSSYYTPPSTSTPPPLPRFHPANFASPNPRAPHLKRPDIDRLAPRIHKPRYLEAQTQLFLHQREIIASITRPVQGLTSSPPSPRLAPIVTSGPVTPLELGEVGIGEACGGYSNEGWLCPDDFFLGGGECVTCCDDPVH